MCRFHLKCEVVLTPLFPSSSPNLTTAAKGETASALQRAVNSLAQREKTKKRRREADGGDADVPYRNPDEIRVRRPAPDDFMDGGEEEEEALVGKRGKKKNRTAEEEEEDEHDGFGMHEVSQSK